MFIDVRRCLSMSDKLIYIATVLLLLCYSNLSNYFEHLLVYHYVSSLFLVFHYFIVTNFVIPVSTGVVKSVTVSNARRYIYKGSK